MKKIFSFLFFFLFCIPTCSALDLQYTKSNCNLSESECSNTANCRYISSKKCGIVATEDISYTCYYKYYNNPTTVFLKATFNKHGITSVEVDHDIPKGSKIIGKVVEKKEPIDATTKNDRIQYYTCPSSLTEYKVENVDLNGISTTQRYYTPVIYELTNHQITYDLLEDKNYNGVMAILPNGTHINPGENVKQPLECKYYFYDNNVKISVIVTYIDDNTITVSELISANSGNSSGLEFDTSYIKKSKEFKNWECSSNGEVYIATDDNKKYIAYNKDDLKDISEYFNTLEGEQGADPGGYNPGSPVSGCEVIPEVVRKWINNILKFVRYVALALVIALGALDFMKAAGEGKPDAMKKAGQSFMKRMIAVVILFLLPVIVDFILNMVNIYGVDKDNIDCMKNIYQ